MHRPFYFEVDTGSRDNFISLKTWKQLNQPKMTPVTCQYRCASGNPLPVLGTITVSASTSVNDPPTEQQFVVTRQPLNLLGLTSIKELKISVDDLVNSKQINRVFDSIKPDVDLQSRCKNLCNEFPEVFQKELGLLKEFELEIKFKPDASPVFHKPRPVPISIQEDLNETLRAGIKKGIWEPTQFNAYGTPVVPIKKKTAPGQDKPSIRVCGDYSVTINPQLETHRHPIPLPEDLMRRLGRGHGFTKIDLADAYNQIQLGPESQKKLALSTHLGVLLQKRLPFGITSAPGHFQEIMDQLTQDLPGVAVYLDDILVSGDDATQHLCNLRRLLQRLQEKGLRCRLDKCSFAQPFVEYLGHYISKDGISKGPKADAITNMPAPTNVSSLRSFLGQVQFYNKFLPRLSTTLEPLYRLTKKDVKWQWASAEQTAFQQIKEALCADTVLVHFDPSLPVGISCDASEVGVGSVLFHRYPDGSERPIANVSKTLTSTQRRYSQIQKEALAIIFGLSKFHQFLYGRRFILVTDHKPLIALFGPTKPIPALAANRLARWALTLSQYDYAIEYRKTSEHGNADALSRLPCGRDPKFDEEETGAECTNVCTVKFITDHLATDPKTLQTETAKDATLSSVIQYLRQQWPRDVPAPAKPFYTVRDTLSVASNCLFYGHRVVVPKSLQPQVLQLLHLGHFGIQRMKQLARTSVYWPGIDADIQDLSRDCQACNEHQKMPPKQPLHPWVTPDKPWSRVHIDHAINFRGHNWLVMVDAYSKYPCIHRMSSITTKATTGKLDEDFSHFGYPHTIVTDNATCFSSQEFQVWCSERGIEHLHGAPYKPQTNGAAERLVQSFKQSLKKSAAAPDDALQEFLLSYRRTPLACGSSPSELLNGRQIRSKIDILIPSTDAETTRESTPQMSQTNWKKRPSSPREACVPLAAHSTQTKTTPRTRKTMSDRTFTVGSPCFVLSFKGGRHDKWRPATVVSVLGHRLYNVRTHPDGLLWRRHIDQLRPRRIITRHQHLRAASNGLSCSEHSL